MKISGFIFGGLLLLSLPSYASVILHDAAGKKVGTAKFVETQQGLKIAVSVSHLKPGPHGIHIHEVAKCEPPDFKSAGGHFDPHHKKHGLKNPKGAHAGDLQNLMVGKNGRAKADFFAAGVSLKKSQMSLVIHANADDEKTDPSGNSGARIACGIIK